MLSGRLACVLLTRIVELRQGSQEGVTDVLSFDFLDVFEYSLMFGLYC